MLIWLHFFYQVAYCSEAML